MFNLALSSNGSRPYVSSIAYNHHASRINDGITPGEEASTSDTAWVSATERLPQWAAVVFPRVARVDRVEIYWGKGRLPESSRNVEVHGRIEAIDPEDRFVVVAQESGDGIAEGDVVAFRNPAYTCSSSYEVLTAESMDLNRYRLELHMSFNLSEGVVRSLDSARGLFATDTCMTKLSACPGLFDGKAIRSGGKTVGTIETAGPDILKQDERPFESGMGNEAPATGTLSYFRFNDPSPDSGLNVGDRFMVCDLNAGDRFTVMRSASRTTA